MKTKVFIAPLVAIIILVAAFYVFNDYSHKEKLEDVTQDIPRVGENPEGEADPARMTLDMTKWNWIKAQYNDGREVLPKKAGVFTLTFNKDGRFSVTTDCNSMSGEYKAQKDLIVFENIASTLMYC
ncbi:MAG: META domain-containing protein, partial [Patescibacteria group bacterium]